MKWKRPLAIAGLIFILAIYVVAIISAFSHSANSRNWLMAAIFSSVVVPVFIYAAQLVYRVINQRDDNEKKDDKTSAS